MKTYTMIYRVTKDSSTECIDGLTFDDMIDRYNDLVKSISFMAIKDNHETMIVYINLEIKE